jgi:hypothetical protein
MGCRKFLVIPGFDTKPNILGRSDPTNEFQAIENEHKTSHRRHMSYVNRCLTKGSTPLFWYKVVLHAQSERFTRHCHA